MHEESTRTNETAPRMNPAEEREEALEILSQFEHVINRAIYRWRKYDAQLHFRSGLPIEGLPIVVWELLRAARMSFLFGIDPGTIASISAAVELALNQTLSGQCSVEEPITLYRAIKSAFDKKHCIDGLLTSDEQVVTRIGKLPRKIAFVQRRNDLDHGSGVFGTRIATIISGLQENEAFTQLSMGQEFLQTWANSEVTKLHADKTHNKREMFGTGPALAITFHNPYDPTFLARKRP